MLVPSHTTQPHLRRNLWAVRSGDDGADISAEAASRYEEDRETIRSIDFSTIGCTA